MFVIFAMVQPILCSYVKVLFFEKVLLMMIVLCNSSITTGDNARTHIYLFYQFNIVGLRPNQ